MKHRPYQRLKQELQRRRLSYQNISQELGISVSTVCRKVNGGSDFYIDEVQKLVACGLSVSLFLE